MRLNKLESIRNLTKIKPLTPLSSSSRIRGEIVSVVGILCLSVHVLCETMRLLESNLTGEELRMKFEANMLIVKKLMTYEKDGYMLKREFEELRKAGGVKERFK